MQSERTRAARLVRGWLTRGALPSRTLQEMPESTPLIREIALGVVRNRSALEFLLGLCCERPPPPEVQAYLLIGIYQLMYLDGVPAYAAVDETVAAARAELHRSQAGFVNAVLRRVDRERDLLRAGLEQQPPAVRWSHPPALVAAWIRQFGAERTEGMLAWNNRPPELHLRLVRSRVSAEAFLDRLAERAISAHPHPARPEEVLVLEGMHRVTTLPGFQQGWFYVMDASTLHAPELLAVRPGERVLDACAAPGGKCVLLAEALDGQGELVAAEPSGGRLERLHENLARMGRTEEVRVVERDLLDEGAWNGDPGFDAVLLDVPCSNTGVIRRRPEARWRFSAREVERQTALQRDLLDAGAARLRPGGRLVYSTCSSIAAENRVLVEAWLDARPGFKLDGEREFANGDASMDGAYAARILRT